MQEIIEQFADYLKGIWLKRRYIIISTWLICPISWVLISQLDNIYESEARVYADTQSILGPLLKGMTVDSKPEEQIQLMVRTLLSRPNLERIVRMSDLDIQAETPKKYEDLIKRLKKDLIMYKTGGLRQNLFNIRYTDKDPRMAQTVVQNALTVFIENALGENRSDAKTAHKFLGNQIIEYENRLLASEARLTSFKQKHNGVLPSQAGGGYYQKLNAVKSKLQAVELELLELETRLETAKKQLSKSVSMNSKQDTIQNENSIKTTFDDRIEELEMNLDTLQLKYTDNHPDVKETLRKLNLLKKQRTDEINQYVSSSENSDSSLNTVSLNPVIQQLQIDINTLKNEVASTSVRANSYREQVKELESKIYILPEIEAELTALNRGYDITKKKYEQLLSRQETASLARKADETTNQFQFKVIDPPRAPVEPVGPKRVLYLIAATIFGLGVGVGLSLLLSQINPVATSSSQIAKATGIPVFGIVSAAENLGLQQWHRKKTIIFIISNSILLLTLIFFIIHAIAPDLILAPIRRIL